MKKAIFILTAILATTLGRGQSFEGSIVYERIPIKDGKYINKSPGKITHKIKGANVASSIKSSDSDLHTIYFGGDNILYLFNEKKKEYILLPEPRLTANENVVIKGTSEMKTILGYKCLKYLFEYTGQFKGSKEIWITKGISGIDGITLGRADPNLNSEEIEGVPLMIVYHEKDASWSIKAIEIKKEKISSSLFELNKSYKVVSHPPSDPNLKY